eukprot:TRINITY_DN124537_c0_g1_i1.p1 TRINITY_DN124537_c0_g1~~TRINITY_DN124537_c0_g1_i1.p1  ORF type:complete len:590 (+),score=152.90 TRINITY_DN124537_c0_g1_i1:83-1852(+)
MASASLSRARADAEARLNEEKKIADRKRNIIVLSARFFQDLGYIDTVQQIQKDTNVNLDKIDAADNVDLPTILTEYEDFYEMRFGRKPKFTRRLEADEVRTGGGGRKVKSSSVSSDGNLSLPRIPGSGWEESRTDDEAAPGARRRAKSERAKPHRHSSDDSTGRDSKRDRPPLAPSASEPSGLVISSQAAKGGKDAAESGSGKDAKDDAAGLDGGLVGQSVSKTNGASRKDSKPDLMAGNEFYDNQVVKALPYYGGDKEYRDLAITISRDILTKNPGVPWDTIVGLENAKALLKEAVVMPLKYPQLFTGLLAPWKGVLLFGPPGTGKTLLAKAVATECETTFFNISASSVVSKWRGDSEKLIRVLFDLARHYQPTTIFIDELDSLMGARGGGDGEHEGSRRMKTELLIQMDGLLREATEKVFLLAASNLPWDLDSAMLRRLEKRVFVALPTAEARRQMLCKHLPCTDGLAKDLDYDKLAGLTEEWSGSDIRLLCKEAAMNPLRRLLRQIEGHERKAEEAASKDKGTHRQKAAEKAKAAAAENTSSVPPFDLKMGPVTEADVSSALERVHRAPAAHLDKYEAWQKSFGAD